MHVVAEALVGPLHVFGEGIIGILHKNSEFIIRGVRFSLYGVDLLEYFVENFDSLLFKTIKDETNFPNI